MTDICSECGFDKDRPRGLIFVKDPISYDKIERARCDECGRVPDHYKGEIIYRDFEGSEQYFEKIREELEE